jgi:hypothetical protein
MVINEKRNRHRKIIKSFLKKRFWRLSGNILMINILQLRNITTLYNTIYNIEIYFVLELAYTIYDCI